MPGWETPEELCGFCAQGYQWLLFEQDSGLREPERKSPQTTERLTGGLVRVQRSHAETQGEEEDGGR